MSDVEEILLETLNDLSKDEFDTFKWYLRKHVLDGYDQIPKSKLESQTRHQTVTLMIDNYSEESAVKVTVEILVKLRNRNSAEKLQKKYAAFKTAAASTSSSAVAPPAAPAAVAAAPAAQTFTAQDGAVVFAPTFNSSTTGPVNINFHK